MINPSWHDSSIQRQPVMFIGMTKRFHNGSVAKDACQGLVHRVNGAVIAKVDGVVQETQQIIEDKIYLKTGMTPPGTIKKHVHNTCWQRNKKKTEWLLHWVTCNNTTRKSNNSCPVLVQHQLTQEIKLVKNNVRILNWSENGTANNKTTWIHLHQKTKVLVKSEYLSVC